MKVDCIIEFYLDQNLKWYVQEFSISAAILHTKELYS